MLPVQPYRPGGYPPGPRWAQFGDDQLAPSIAHEARGKLAAKRHDMAHFHIGRLQEAGYLPAFEPGMFQTNRDPAEQGREAYDHPTMRSQNPFLGPDAPMGTQTDTYTETGTGPDDGHDRPDHGGGGIRRPGIITPFTSGVARGFGSTAARLGGALIEGGIHGMGLIAGAGIGAMTHGAVGGVQRLAGIEPANPLDLVPDESPEPLAIEDRPRAARAKAKAEPLSPYYGSGASSSSSPPQRTMPFGLNFLAPAVPVEVPTFDLTMEDTEEEAPPGPAAAAARPRRRRRTQAEIMREDAERYLGTAHSGGPMTLQNSGRGVERGVRRG